MAITLSTDVFTIPWKGKFIVYAPVKNVAFFANAATADLLASVQEGRMTRANGPAHRGVMEFLRNEGLMGRRAERTPSRRPDKGFRPTTVTLFPTSNCSLRCVYCYANGGDKRQDMEPEVAKAAIDLVAANAAAKKGKVFHVAFHGGGEPAVAWRVFAEAVLYARKRAKQSGLKARIHTASNAVLSDTQIEWVARKLDGINISFDGPKDIQDAQRPFRNGAGSYAKVVSCIRKFEKLKFNYGLRVTVTDKSVHRLAEIVDVIHSNFSIKRVHVEPLFVCGRCHTTGIGSPAPEMFVREFKKAAAAADRWGMQLRYSGAGIDSLQSIFCGASGYNFCVTPDGHVTSCYEVSTVEDPRSQVFIYGNYDRQTSRFVFDNDKIAFLRSKTVHNMPHCADCFCKWSCAGDCIAKHVAGKDGAPDGSWRCEINRELSKWELARRLERAGRQGDQSGN